MRKSGLWIAGAVLTAALALGGRAEAMTLPSAAAIAAAADELRLTEDVRTVCRRVWNGYRWRTHCYWVPARRVVVIRKPVRKKRVIIVR